MMVRRTSVAVAGIALVVSACSGDGSVTDEITVTSVQTTAAAVDAAPSTSTPPDTAAVISPEPTLPGEWVRTVFYEDRFVEDFALTADSELLALLHDWPGRFRILKLGDGGGWGAVMDWVAPSTDGFNHVGWLSLTVFDAPTW